jgi:hypothetical protein
MHDVTLEQASAARFRIPSPAAKARLGAVPYASHRFHLWMGGLFAAIAFAGFVPSYWAKLASGTFDAAPIIHIHGALFFAWTGFYVIQTALVASGHTSNHRAWGLAGISLFSVMLCTTAALGIRAMHVADHLGIGDAGRQFSVVTFILLALLAGLFAAAIVNVRRPEVHKRLMLLMMIVLVQPALARLCALLLAPAGGVGVGPPPLVATIPTNLASDILILVAMVHDWRTRGRPHEAYVWGASVILVAQLLIIPVGRSAAWMSLAGTLQHLMG